MHVDQDEHHGWLRDEDAFLRRLVAKGLPVLGVCLGGQLLAKALDAPVRRMPSPQVGWHETQSRGSGRGTIRSSRGCPLASSSFQWHSYAFDLPPGAVLLASDNRCNQAFRAGTFAWALQFHAEVAPESLRQWIESAEGKADRNRRLRPPARRERSAHRALERDREGDLRAVPGGRGSA